MQESSEAASDRKTPSYPHPTCQDQEARRKGKGREGLHHFLDNTAPVPSCPHLPPAVWTPQT